MDYDKLMAQARATNAERDRIDREQGNATPLEAGPEAHIGTIAAAIEAGIRTGDWNCIAEAQAMILEVVDLLRRVAR